MSTNLAWAYYTSNNKNEFLKELQLCGPSWEIRRLITHAVMDNKLWAVKMYSDHYSSADWVIEVLRYAVKSNKLKIFLYLEKNKFFDKDIVQILLTMALEQNSTKVITYLLNTYEVSHYAEAHQIFTYGLYFTLPKTRLLVLRHPCMIEHLYIPYIHSNPSYYFMVNGQLKFEKKRRRIMNWRLCLLYRFLVKWATEVRFRPGNSEFQKALLRWKTEATALIVE